MEEARRRVFGGFDLRGEFFEPAHEEAAGAAGVVGHVLAEAGMDHAGHEIGDGAGGVEFPGAACALEGLEDGFVDVAEGVAFFGVGEV